MTTSLVELRVPAAQHALQLTKELLIVRAPRALLLESFTAKLGR